MALPCLFSLLQSPPLYAIIMIESFSRCEVSTIFFFKKKYPAVAKYKAKDFVNFYYQSEIRFGWIYDSEVDKSGAVSYTIQIGGQCPSLLYDIPESKIIGLKKD